MIYRDLVAFLAEMELERSRMSEILPCEEEAIVIPNEPICHFCDGQGQCAVNLTTALRWDGDGCGSFYQEETHNINDGVIIPF